MFPSEHETRIVAMVDSFTKTVARNFSRNLKWAKRKSEETFLRRTDRLIFWKL